MSSLIPRELYGVIGWPLAQTLSPLLHNTGFRVLNIPAAYISWPLPPGELKIFLDAMKILRIRGCSVTIPHKIAVLPFLDSISEGATLAGAVNTLFWRDGALCGENTDIAGFLAPLEDVDIANMSILLLGAGGAAHAVAAALKMRGSREVRVASPSNKRQFELAERFGFTAIRWEDRYDFPARLVINSTPLGMLGENVNASAYDFARGPNVTSAWAYDLVYNPLETVFLRQAAITGRKCISGLEMFFGQGNAQFRLWTGHNLPAEARSALEKALK